MKIHPWVQRTIADPIAGITFTEPEDAYADEMARTLAQLPHEVQAQLRRAMAYEARRLNEATEWTIAEMVTERRGQYGRALITLHALDKASFIAPATA